MGVRSTSMQTLARHSGLAGLLMFAAASLLLIFQPTDVAWWAVRLLGLATLMLVVGSTILRPAFGRRPWHKIFGWTAAAALLGHIAVVATFQPAFWRYLTPAVPVEIVAGLVAALAFFVTLSAQRLPALRRCPGPFLHQKAHRVAGYMLVAATSAHIALIAGMNLVAVMVFAGSALILVGSFLRERHVMSLAVALGLFIAFMVELAGGTLATSRLTALRRAPIDHSGFLHTDHVGLSCTGCHHNFIDVAGTQNCLNCHKRTSLSETTRIDRTFHAFCSDCHRMDRKAARKSGPIDDCSGCHAYNSGVDPGSNTRARNILATVGR